MNNQNPTEGFACPVEKTMAIIGDKWKILIIRDLLRGTKRFGELKKSVTGISQKMLTQQLKSLERDGIVTRVVYAEIPPKVEYTLTSKGQSLKDILKAMAVWGRKYLD